MCDPVSIGATFASIGSSISAGVGAVGSAIGTAASGLTFGQALSFGGTALSAGGSIAGGLATASAARTNAKLAERQSAMERSLAAVEDTRLRERMRATMATQRAQLIGRGVSLDSPTAVLLGRRAAQELSFASQSVRSGSAARTAELSAESRAYRARSGVAVLKGTVDAASSLLTKAPDIWPGLKDRKLIK